MGLLGMKGEGAETLIRLAFSNNFPQLVSVKLQQIENVDKMKVLYILSRARILIGSRTAVSMFQRRVLEQSQLVMLPISHLSKVEIRLIVHELRMSQLLKAMETSWINISIVMTLT